MGGILFLFLVFISFQKTYFMACNVSRLDFDYQYPDRNNRNIIGYHFDKK